ncbi:MAG: PAS domain-containing protein [Alkalispirochaetaceae bacterium]
MSLRFDDPDLPKRLSELTDEELENAPFGIIRMKPDGRVTLYNRAESALSGIGEEQALEHNLFRDVAPCTNNFMVAGRYEEEELDAVVEYVLTFAMEPREVTLRLIRRGDLLFMLVKPN